MKSRLSGLIAFLLIAGGAESQAQPSAGRELAGVWVNQGGTRSLKPLDGSPIPFSQMGRDEYKKNKILIKQIDGQLPAPGKMDRCIPAGVPRIWGSKLPFQIIQTPQKVAIQYELNHTRRFIYLDQGQDPNADSTFMGNSVGRWEGGVLVVESTGFKDRTYLDDTGLPHSEELKISERISRSKNRLEVSLTISDPIMYTKPWKVREQFSFQPNGRIEEYVCAIGEVRSRLGLEGARLRLKSRGH